MTDLASIATEHSGEDLDLVPLPIKVVDTLVTLNARPRLVAHLRLVHDTACALTHEVREQWPELAFDQRAVLDGAAVHDIGKAIHPDELSGPGRQHELDGGQLLRDHGFGPEVARFARSHAEWSDDEAAIEDRLVALADKVWKGRREDDLEQLLIVDIAEATGQERWEVFSQLDAILTTITDDADARLAFQNQYPA